MSQYAGFDIYAAQRKAEAQLTLQDFGELSRAARELNELEEGTEAIEQGMSDGWLWFWLAAGLVAAPFTLGISLLISLAAGIKMNGGPKHMIKSAMPMTVDIVAPKAGFVRVVSGIATLALVLLATVFILALIAYNMGISL